MGEGILLGRRGKEEDTSGEGRRIVEVIRLLRRGREGASAREEGGRGGWKH